MSRKVESVDMLLLGEKSTLIKEPSEPTTSPCFDIVSVAMTKKSSVSTVIRSFAMTKREFSQEDKATIDAIFSYALSIVLVSVVDRPLADVRKFNDMIPKPDFKIMKRNSSELAKETAFALPALNYKFCDAPVAISFPEQT
ncbi:BnaC01g23610D [Brassica napus]|uniref:(rape) hypothetical protein n=1 Tax=Brassica napus TaxID=3708 RepID=A0A078FTA8_BRANA|nr:unnamed protein product [Brassica napus]CDY16326.1 BnaC01g23610D [Brassica napus]